MVDHVTGDVGGHKSEGMLPVLDRNIRTLQERRRRERAGAGLQEKIAEAITRFSGSMIFVYVHLVFVAAWVAVNVGFCRACHASTPPSSCWRRSPRWRRSSSRRSC